MSAKKWHINKKGMPGECNAKENCPLGFTSNDHFKSVEEAQEFVDYSNESGYDLANMDSLETAFLMDCFKEDRLNKIFQADDKFKKSIEDFFEVNLDEPSFYEFEIKYDLMNKISKENYQDFLKNKTELQAIKDNCRNEAISNIIKGLSILEQNEEYGDESDLFAQENIKFLFKAKKYDDIFLEDREFENEEYRISIEYINDYNEELDYSERKIKPVLTIVNKKSGYSTSRVIYNNNLSRTNFIDNRILDRVPKEIEKQGWSMVDLEVFDDDYKSRQLKLYSKLGVPKNIIIEQFEGSYGYLVKEDRFEDFIKDNFDNEEALSDSLDYISDKGIKENILEIIEESYDWETLDLMSIGSLEPRYRNMTEYEKSKAIENIYQDEWEKFYAEELKNKNPIFIKDFSDKLKDKLKKQSIEKDGEKFYLFGQN